jgi:hypothetical protein
MTTKQNRFPARKCQNCKNSRFWFHPGSFEDPPDGGWDCQTGSPVVDMIELHDEDVATWCPEYKEILFEVCGTCGKPLSQPKHTWPLWCNAWEEPIPVCSQECLDKENAKYSEYFNELQKDLYGIWMS